MIFFVINLSKERVVGEMSRGCLCGRRTGALGRMTESGVGRKKRTGGGEKKKYPAKKIHMMKSRYTYRDFYQSVN